MCLASTSGLTVQAVLQLLGPLKYLSNLPDVGKLFQQAEQDRKTAQEMVAGEMDV